MDSTLRRYIAGNGFGFAELCGIPQLEPEHDDSFSQLCLDLLGDAYDEQPPDVRGPNCSTSPTTVYASETLCSDDAARTHHPSPTPRSTRKNSNKKRGQEDATTARSQRQIKLKLQEAERKLQLLTQQQELVEAENTRLRGLNKTLSACVEFAEFRHRMSEIVHRAPRAPLPLPASCSQVSFSELPPSSCWDASWLSRIKALKPQDYLVLRRQWVQQSAVLLPQVWEHGPGSSAYAAMSAMHSKHIDLARALATLAPGVWLQSSQFSMDDLRPIQGPKAEWVRDLFKRLLPPDVLLNVFRSGTEYQRSTDALHAEFDLLLQRYNRQAAELDLQQLGGGSGEELGGAGSRLGFGFGLGALSAHHSGVGRREPGCLPEYVEQLELLDGTAKLLQDNTNKQHAALLKLFTTMYQGFHPRRLNIVLMMYPLACTSADLIPGILLLGDADTGSAQPQDPATAPSPA